MQTFIPRTSMPFPAAPLLDLPMWLSKLLYMRGVDTDEKAEKFLYPKLADLYDPFLMPGMQKAVGLIQSALSSHQSIIIYGDYDVDGICASAILYKTLQKLGADVSYYLPDRHEEGYGLNVEAVKALSQKHKLLITVDCGITNHEEVSLAMALDMTVIVTDHHEPAPTPSPAHAVLNPLLGYPFPRLCGAGVSYKLCEALAGPEKALPLLPLCALATVADIVPLIDENRVIVKHGLEMMQNSDLVGLNALIAECGLNAAPAASDLAFRLAPRLNAAGRLSDAGKGLKLLLSDDATEAAQMAAALSAENDLRRRAQEEMTLAALQLIKTQVDFKTDRAIIIVGDGFNPGVIGLCAGKLCEKYHYPTLILSRREDGLLVGSARSIKGVNIHQALSLCRDLFLRFGGHAQAAGLTMEEAFLPELRRRLSLAINEISDPQCYIEQKEYDLPLDLSETTFQMADALSRLEPTGYGNPAPVFLTRGVSIQRSRAVGRDGAHLSLGFLHGSTLRDGIFFSNGHLARKDIAQADVLYTPNINTFRGESKVQLMVEALEPCRTAQALPENDMFSDRLLQDLSAILSNYAKIPLCENPVVHPLDREARSRLLKGVQGTLVIARTRETALKYESVLPAVLTQVDDPRGFSSLLVLPDTLKLKDAYRHILLADGALCPEEVRLIKTLCPGAALYAPKEKSRALKAAIAPFVLSDETLRDIYKAVMRLKSAPPEKIQDAVSLTHAQVDFAIRAFLELELVACQNGAVTLLPPKKCALSSSPLIAGLRSAAGYP